MANLRKISLGVLLLAVFIPLAAQAQTAPVQLVEVAGGLTRPVNLTHAGDSRIFVVEQDGRIKIIENGAVNPTAFLDVSTLISRGGSEQGLLGLAFHPNYAQNGWFFINYTDRQGDTIVARYSASGNVADPASAAVVLTIDQPYANHNGGHLAFGPDGLLYIGMGDGGSGGDPQNRAQNPQALLGKMLRINVDQLPYSVPTDNPFVGNSAYLPEIWALGVRNPWRYSFDRTTGDLYMADVGQNMWEEVNFQAAGTGGLNYGWNVYEGNHPFNGGTLANAVAPIAEYDHAAGCSITGGYVYRGSLVPSLQGVYLYADYCSGTIWSASRNGSGTWESSVFLDTDYNVTSFGEDQAGELYVVDHNGAVLRLESTAPVSTATPIPTTEMPPTEVVPTATSETPATPVPPTATVAPTTPTLRIDVAVKGSEVNAALNLFNVANLYGLQITCQADPAVLAGTSYVGGEFNDSNSYFVSPGYQPDGSWTVAATRLQPNTPLRGNITALTLTYGVQGLGSSAIACAALAVDQNGFELPLDVQNGFYSNTPEETETVEAPVTPTEVMPTVTEVPPTEITPAPTLEITAEPTVVGVLSTISGLAAYQNRIDNAGITAQLLAADGTLITEQVTGADGSYQFADVPVGVYSVRLAASQHLSSLREAILVESDGQALDLGSVTLRAGDVDGSGTIGLEDATLVGANFGVDAPPAPIEVDLNSDSRVNISDLVLVGSNFGLAEPISGQ